MNSQECVVPIHKPKTAEMLFFFACGMITSIPMATLARALVDPYLGTYAPITAALISIAIFTPFIEEFSKIFPLYYRHGETQRSILHLAIMVGLGFALVELLEYVLLLGTPALYRLPGFFFHPASTLIAAYGIATKRPLTFYALAVALHFGNNFYFFAISTQILNPLPFSVTILISGLTVWLAWIFYRRTTEKVIT